MTCSCCSGSSTPTQSRTAYLAYCTYYVQTHRQARTGANQPTRREACCNLFIFSGWQVPTTDAWLSWLACRRAASTRSRDQRAIPGQPIFIHSFIHRPAGQPPFLPTYDVPMYESTTPGCWPRSGDGSKRDQPSSDCEPLPKPTLSPFARGYLSL